MSILIKKNDSMEIFDKLKIENKINKLINFNLKIKNKYLDIYKIIDKLESNIYSGINSNELDNQCAEICVNLSTTYPFYSYLGSRFLIYNLHKKTLNNFTDKMLLLPTINKDWLNYILDNKNDLNNMINYERDYLFDYFGYKTLEKSYLLKDNNNNIIERPQDVFLRTAITLQMGNLNKIKETYDKLSLGNYIHASPTLFNSGTNHMQLSSCFVENTEVITMDGIKNIQDVKINDEIVTHTGKIKKVLQLHKNNLNDRNIMLLNVYNSKPIYVTNNHKFWSISDLDLNPKWRSIDELSNDYFIGIPKYDNKICKEIFNNPDIYKYTNNMYLLNNLHLYNNIKKYYVNLSDVMIYKYKYFRTNYNTKIINIICNNFYNKYKNIIYINTDIAKLFGIFISIGSTNYMSVLFKINKISDTINCIINDIMYNNFNINPVYEYNKNNKSIIYYSHILTTIFIYYVSNNYENLIKSMINWDIELLNNFLEGMKISNYKNNDLSIHNSLYHVFRLHGINYSYYIDKNYNDFKICDCFNFLYKKESFVNKKKIINNNIFLRVDSITKTNIKPNYVYTLGIEDDHSYNVEGLICENCFLLGTNDDLTDITKTWNSCAQISKWAGGIGLHISNIRGNNSIIHGTGGKSNGIVPFLKVFNEIARWIDQGGKRPGSIAIYLEPHHPDIFEFIELKKNFGSDTERTRDLFLALWVSDLFMKQVENNEDWYLLSNDDCPGLTEVYGINFENLYWKYVNENKYRKKVDARKLWLAILDSQIETGLPYIVYKDSVNQKNNQKNLGTIKSSNLCAEIVQYSDNKEYAVCNLASISLKSCIEEYEFNSNDIWTIYSTTNCKYCNYAKNYLNNFNIKYIEIEKNNLTFNELKLKINKNQFTYPQIFINNILIGGWDDFYKYTCSKFNYDKLYDISYLATVNLNKVIDINYYPIIETKISNMKHRPIGLGIQGLADCLVLLRLKFDSDEVIDFNSKIMETIYLACITASNDIAIERYTEIKELIKISIIYPEYYDKHFIIENETHNNIYHKLKPTIYELQKNINNTTLGSYSTFEGSLFSEGKLQFDMWDNVKLHYTEKWDILKKKVKKYGTRNSLLTALMPTASTSQILGNNECFEFFTNNIYTRKTQAGDFIIVNKYLINDLISIGVWSLKLKDKIISNNGSIQSIQEIPSNIKEIYKNIWEIKQLWVLKAALARSPFIDQTQSMNIFMDSPDYQRLTSMHFWGWKNKLKTGMYYLRTKPSSDATKFTIDPTLIKESICENCSA